MLITISPAKTLDDNPVPKNLTHSSAEMLEQSERVIRKLRTLSHRGIKSLMNISDDLATLNQQRYQDFSPPFTPDNAKQAVMMFKGDVYKGLGAADFNKSDLAYSQKHLRILSGLYGSLRPLDLIQPYRLEMGTKLAVGRRRDLYAFWNSHITNSLNAAIAEQGDDVLVNLASNEYFGAVKPKDIDARIVRPDFREERNGKYQMISFFIKKARGLLARFIIKKRLTDPGQLKAFDLEGYSYNESLSKPDKPMFTRSS